jgi:hypothetical protein
VSPDETTQFQQAVDHARERLDDLSTLMVMANTLDQEADVNIDRERQHVS